MHPDRLSDLKLQNLLLTQLIESSPIQYGEFMESFLQYLEIERSQSKPDYWRIRVLNLLREMQVNDRWIACYHLNVSDEKIPVSIWDPNDIYIIEITRKGTRKLREIQRLLSEETKQKEKRFKAIINTELPLLVRKYDYPKPRGSEVAKEKTHREAIAKAIATRRGQKEFRQKLLRTYKKCQVTICNAEDTLEAAHIRPYSSGGTFDISNGLLLRADIHTLFDLGLIAIDTKTMTVVIASALKDTTYGKYAGKRLYFPKGTVQIPDRDALDQHRKETGL